MLLPNNAGENEPPTGVEPPPNPGPIERPEPEEQPDNLHGEQPRLAAERFDLQQQLRFQNDDKAQEQIIEAQCDLFLKMGIENFRSYYGEAIGLIFGENDIQSW